MLQSENDSGTTSVNLLARHLINELYFSLDDLAAAAEAGDKVIQMYMYTHPWVDQ